MEGRRHEKNIPELVSFKGISRFFLCVSCCFGFGFKAPVLLEIGNHHPTEMGARNASGKGGTSDFLAPVTSSAGGGSLLRRRRLLRHGRVGSRKRLPLCFLVRERQRPPAMEGPQKKNLPPLFGNPKTVHSMSHSLSKKAQTEPLQTKRTGHMFVWSPCFDILREASVDLSAAI